MNTIREHIERGDEIVAHCNTYGCGHSGTLNLTKLRLRWGEDFDMIDRRQVLLSRLVCTKCGARFPSTTLSSGAAKRFDGLGTTWGGG